MPKKSGKPIKPPPKRDGPLSIDLPFEEAVRAALQAKPPNKAPPKRKRS